MTAVGFEPTQLALVELESTPLDHSGKLSVRGGGCEQVVVQSMLAHAHRCMRRGYEACMTVFSHSAESCMISFTHTADRYR